MHQPGASSESAGSAPPLPALHTSTHPSSSLLTAASLNLSGEKFTCSSLTLIWCNHNCDARFRLSGGLFRANQLEQLTRLRGLFI